MGSVSLSLLNIFTTHNYRLNAFYHFSSAVHELIRTDLRPVFGSNCFRSIFHMISKPEAESLEIKS